MTDDDPPRRPPPTPDSVDRPENVVVETARPADELDVRRLLDAAMLDVDPALDERIAAGDVLVARVVREAGDDRGDAVAGALVVARPDPDRRHVDAVVVRRARRGLGIGSALVANAVARAASTPDVTRVTAAFDPSLRGFYTDLGFVVGADPDPDADRVRGVVEVGSERRE